MADNVVVSAGTGTTIAADEVSDGTLGSCKVQYVKIMDGTLDGTNKAAVGANGLAVAVASGGIASGAVASGAIASGAIASGAVASGAIAAGAIAAGATSIAENEDVASADGDRGVKIMFKRLDTPANASGTDGDYEQPQMSAGRVWTSTVVTGTVAVTQSGTWDEVGINDSGNSITVDNGGTFAVQVDGSALTALQKIDDPVLVDDAAFTPATSSVMMAGFEADEGSTDSVDEGDAGAARMTLDRKIITTPQPHTAGGLSLFRSLDLDETEEEVKGTAGCLYKLRITNFSTSIRYVKLYNATAASVSVGTTTPVDTIPVPGATSATQPTVITENYGGLGLTLDTAICLAATTALADNDTGAPSANDVVVSAYYK